MATQDMPAKVKPEEGSLVEERGCYKQKVHWGKLGAWKCRAFSLAELGQSLTGWAVAEGGETPFCLLLG